MLLLAAALLIATCGIGLGLSARQRPAIPVSIGNDLTGWASSADLINLSVPVFGNRSSLPIRLHQVTFAARSAHVRLLRVFAFRTDRFGYMALGHGDLVRHCSVVDHPGPLTNVVIPPHADPDWEVMVELRIDAPGRYVIGPVRITYAEAGRLGWQDQNLGTTMVISAARPGHRPPSNGC